MEEVLKHTRKLLRVNTAKGKLINAMGLLSHVAAEIVGHSETNIDGDEYSSVISILQEWKNKIETEESMIMGDIVAVGRTANKRLESTPKNGV